MVRGKKTKKKQEQAGWTEEASGNNLTRLPFKWLGMFWRKRRKTF